MLVGVSEAPIVFFLKLVLRRSRCGITLKPELLNELEALLIASQANIFRSLVRSDDVSDVFLYPLLIWLGETCG
jgi:hypothetical protein